MPDYVKVAAAIYADGSSSGVPDKVSQLMEWRKSLLTTTRALIARLEKGKSGDKAALAADLKQWAEPMKKLSKSNHQSQAAIDEAAAKKLITNTAEELDSKSVDEVLTKVRASETTFAASKPAL